MADKLQKKSKGPKRIVLGVTGSIAAYKAAELASLLVKQGHDVFVVMTAEAVEFITPLTLQTLSKNPVTTSFFDEKENWRPGHIELADRANLLPHRTGNRERHCRIGKRICGKSTGRYRSRNQGPYPGCPGHEWKNVGTPSHARKCRTIEIPRR